MTPAQAHALLGDGDDRAPRERGREKPASREGWTKIRNKEDLEAVLSGKPRPE